MTPSSAAGNGEGPPSPAGPRNAAIPCVDYSIRRPEIAREITSSWICSVPSKMS